MHLLNKLDSDRIDMRTVNNGITLSTEQIKENLKQFFSACRGLIWMLGIDIDSFINKNAPVMLDVIGQILCLIATNVVSFQSCPEIMRLTEDSEEPADLLKLLPEQLLLRWFNHHLAKASQLKVNNLGINLKSCKPLFYVMHQLDSSKCKLDGIDETDNLKRAEIIINNSYALGCGDILSV